MKALALAALAIFLAGCAHSQPKPEIQYVEVSVKVPCIDKAPTKPVYRTGVGPYPGEKEAALILADDFEKAEQYGEAWSAAAAGCLMPAAPRLPLPANPQ